MCLLFRSQPANEPRQPRSPTDRNPTQRAGMLYHRDNNGPRIYATTHRASSRNGGTMPMKILHRRRHVSLIEPTRLNCLDSALLAEGGCFVCCILGCIGLT